MSGRLRRWGLLAAVACLAGCAPQPSASSGVRSSAAKAPPAKGSAGGGADSGRGTEPAPSHSSPAAVARVGEPLRAEHGTFRGETWAAAWVDPSRLRVDLAVYGRAGEGWSDRYAPVDELPRDILAALNGTFFSLQHHEPVGVLVYAGGQQTWTPRVKKWIGARQVKVASLHRWYVAVLGDGRVRVGNSQGRRAERLRADLEAQAAGARVQCLMGGGGLLVAEGRSAYGSASLRQAGFDARSGLRGEEHCRRTAVGCTRDGHLLLLTSGLDGNGLPLADLAALCVTLGAVDAVLFDCGSSTALRVPARAGTGSSAGAGKGSSAVAGKGGPAGAGVWQRGGRAVPVWWVVRSPAGGLAPVARLAPQRVEAASPILRQRTSQRDAAVERAR